MNRGHRILIVVADTSFNWSNENSAVVNYLRGVGDFLKSKGSTVDYFPLDHDSPRLIFKNTSSSSILKNLIRNYFTFFYNSLRLQKQLKRQKNLIHSYDGGHYDVCIELLTFGSDFSLYHVNSFGKRIVIFDSPLKEQFIDLQGSSAFQMGLLIKREKYALKKADAVICYSLAVKNYLMSNYGLKNVVEIPCVVWKEKVNEERKNNIGITIGFIGSFLKWHKVERLVKAFEMLASKFADVSLVLIGKGEEWERIKRMVDNSRFSERITMTGFVSEEELVQLKARIDIGVMPGSNWYGSPLKLFEYMESGIPVIGPDTPTVRTLFSDKDLLLIPNTNDPIPLFNSLQQLYSSEALRQSLSKQGKRLMATKFAKEAIMGKFEELLIKLNP